MSEPEKCHRCGADLVPGRASCIQCSAPVQPPPVVSGGRPVPWAPIGIAAAVVVLAGAAMLALGRGPSEAPPPAPPVVSAGNAPAAAPPAANPPEAAADVPVAETPLANTPETNAPEPAPEEAASGSTDPTFSGSEDVPPPNFGLLAPDDGAQLGPPVQLKPGETPPLPRKGGQP